MSKRRENFEKRLEGYAKKGYSIEYYDPNKKFLVACVTSPISGKSYTIKG